jgi:hypothetical protein
VPAPAPALTPARAPALARVLALALALALAPTPASADDVTAGAFVRTDTDGTTVVTPRASVEAGVIDDATTVRAGYAADIWTSASIDVRTAATAPVTEQRDEIVAGVARELTEVSVRAGYRFSHENDYVSHGGSAGIVQRLAEGNATVEVALQAAADTVGRSGDEAFARSLATVGARVVYTQVIDPHTIVQGAYELTRREGYQASPYRFVGLGGDGLCNGTAQLCVPESHPSLRLRNAIVASGRRALGALFSAGLEYRFYFDDWGITSHTVAAQLAWLPGARTELLARYRFYWQEPAEFYRARYEVPAGAIQYVTRDRELGPISTHRLVLALEHDLDLTAAGPAAELTLAVAGSLLDYRDFVGLDTVLALDVTLAFEVEL